MEQDVVQNTTVRRASASVQFTSIVSVSSASSSSSSPSLASSALGWERGVPLGFRPSGRRPKTSGVSRTNAQPIGAKQSEMIARPW